MHMRGPWFPPKPRWTEPCSFMLPERAPFMFQFRTWNLQVVRGKAGDSEFVGKIVAPNSPWIAVAVDTDDPQKRAEISGGLSPR
jgi:hypothetical protein